MGGLLTLGSWVRTFPEIDTTTKALEGLSQAEKDHRSTIQGTFGLEMWMGSFPRSLL